MQTLDLLAGGDDRDRRIEVSGRVREDAPLLLGARILDHDVEHEAIELGLGQRIGAFLLDRVLRRQDEQRPIEGEPRAVDRDLVLLHRFEQRRLGLRRRAVDFVGEQDVGEHRAADEANHAASRRPVLFDHLCAEDVGGHQVGRELDAVELEVDCLRQLLDHQRLGQAGHAAQQAVAAGEERDENLADDALLADDGLGELPLETCRDVGHPVQVVTGDAFPAILPDIHVLRVYRRPSGCHGPATVVAQSFDTFAGGEVPVGGRMSARHMRARPDRTFMPTTSKWQSLPTEAINPVSLGIDKAPVRDIIEMVVNEDRKVISAVQKEKERIAHGIEIITQALKKGGRVIFVGAGTSGRLGVVEASEMPPTFGTSPKLVQAIMAGGQEAVFRAKEGVEDNYEEGARSIGRLRLSKKDVVIGVSASGMTPFVRGGLTRARQAQARASSSSPAGRDRSCRTSSTCRLRRRSDRKSSPARPA